MTASAEQPGSLVHRIAYWLKVAVHAQCRLMDAALRDTA